MTSAGPPPAPRLGRPVWIDSTHRLREKAERWRRLPAVGVDTEFVRERTFYPRLGLIQVGDGHENVLIDPLAITDLDPLREVLLAPEVVKVVHSCSEDLEVLYHRFEAFPGSLFDTQIAAKLTGLGASLAYGALVAELCGDEVPKGETRSNWLRRPLTDRQLTYAALDVAYLLPAHRRLQRELRRLDRESWLREETEQLCDSRRFLPDPDAVYLAFARWSMSRRELAVLRAVAAWREREARRRDLPRNFVLPKDALADLARRQPGDARDLAAVASLRPQDRQRHGAALLHLVRQALALPPADLPPEIPRPLDLRKHRTELRRIRRAVADKAEALGIPAETLATRKTVETLVRRRLAGESPVVPESMTSWQRRILAGLLPEGAAAPRG